MKISHKKDKEDETKQEAVVIADFKIKLCEMHGFRFIAFDLIC